MERNMEGNNRIRKQESNDSDSTVIYSDILFVNKDGRLVNKNLSEPEVRQEQPTFPANLLCTYKLLHKMKGLKISIATTEGIKFYPSIDIIRLEACEGNYTFMYLKNVEKPILITKGLVELEKRLPQELFCRIHHSHIVNLEYIQEIKKTGGVEVILEDNSVVMVSRRRQIHLSKSIEAYNII